MKLVSPLNPAPPIWSSKDIPDKPGLYDNTITGYYELYASLNGSSELEIIMRIRSDAPAEHVAHAIAEMIGVWNRGDYIDPATTIH